MARVFQGAGWRTVVLQVSLGGDALPKDTEVLEVHSPFKVQASTIRPVVMTAWWDHGVVREMFFSPTGWMQFVIGFDLKLNFPLHVRNNK